METKRYDLEGLGFRDVDDPVTGEKDPSYGYIVFKHDNVTLDKQLELWVFKMARFSLEDLIK
jgi:hypothetical protein